MTFLEEKKNLFDMPNDYALVHCISADFALGAGIAKQFQQKYNTKNELRQRCQGYTFIGGDCLGTGSHDTRVVFNLVTKNRAWDKPLYEDLEKALNELFIMCQIGGYNKLAMPRIGCGLDGLDWSKVKPMIMATFSHSEIEVVICSL